MRIDRVKLIAEMARQDIRITELSEKSTVSRSTICAARCGRSITTPSAQRIANALNMPLKNLLEEVNTK